MLKFKMSSDELARAITKAYAVDSAVRIGDSPLSPIVPAETAPTRRISNENMILSIKHTLDRLSDKSGAESEGGT